MYQHLFNAIVISTGINQAKKCLFPNLKPLVVLEKLSSVIFGYLLVCVSTCRANCCCYLGSNETVLLM